MHRTPPLYPTWTVYEELLQVPLLSSPPFPPLHFSHFVRTGAPSPNDLFGSERLVVPHGHTPTTRRDGPAPRKGTSPESPDLPPYLRWPPVPYLGSPILGPDWRSQLRVKTVNGTTTEVNGMDMLPYVTTGVGPWPWSRPDLSKRSTLPLPIPEST